MRLIILLLCLFTNSYADLHVINQQLNPEYKTETKTWSAETPKKIKKFHFSDLTSMQEKMDKLLAQVAKQNAAQFHPIANKNTKTKLFYAENITSTPVPDLKATFSGENLIINFPSINENLRILQFRQQLSNYFAAEKISLDHPRIFLSGGLGLRLNYSRHSQQPVHRAEPELSALGINIFSVINPWISSLISLGYDSGTRGIATPEIKVDNSRIQLRRGFITFGNLDKSPYYLSAGQMYIPFGSFSSAGSQSTLPGSLGRILGRAISSGYTQQGFSSTLFIMQSPSLASESLNQWGWNIKQEMHLDKTQKFELGFSFLHNLTDANQVLSALKEDRIAAGETTLHINNAIPAIDFYSKLSLTDYTFIIEYLTATRHFSTNDFSGIKPKALHLEAQYHIPQAEHPLHFALGYDQSFDAASLNLAKKSLFFRSSTNVWPNTSQGIEWRHNWNYPGSSLAMDSVVFDFRTYF
jgi:hypothetical protein